MKKELLSPAGNMEALKSAVMNGADAVYIGGKRFGARAFASNFSMDEIKEAIFFCHLYGVKLYVTVNTMIYESELEEVLSYISFLYCEHVDAIIMADLGLMKLCMERFPDLEIHASTQAHTHNISQIEVLKTLGVKRVVLARELSLEEIKKFPQDMEYEVFIHGALCISYSGQCLFSSLLLNRSGNRGECAQICRLPFKFLQDGVEVKTKGNYLLSTKDLNTSKRFQELLATNVYSFKIEGRMKSPAYVGFITRMYRRLIEEYEQSGRCQTTLQEQKDASVLFGRGFTEGKLFHQAFFDYINQEASNHQGILIGTVCEVTGKKIKIKLNDFIHQGDGIRFALEEKGMIVNFLYNQKGLLISSAKKGDIVFVDNKIKLTKKGDVLKTLDVTLQQKVSQYPKRKIPITLHADISLSHGFLLQLSDGEHLVSIGEKNVFPAQKCPITKSKVIEQLNRFQNTPFCLTNIEVTLDDNLFINIRDINEMRRRAVDELIQKRVWRKRVKILDSTRHIHSYDKTLRILATARNEEQVKTLLDLDIDRIYVDDYEIYKRYQNEGVLYRSNRVQPFGIHDDYKEMLVGETGSLIQSSCIKHTDYFLNVSNHATSEVLEMFGARRITLTPEMSSKDLRVLLKQYPNGNPFEWIVYGRLEAMVMNHCIVKTNLYQSGVCKLCKENHAYALMDRNGAVYPLVMDENHRTHLFFHQVMNHLDKLEDYYEWGIRNFRLEFFDESPKEIVKIVKTVKNYLHF